ncbi:hypothetical protein AAG906_024549 [Vitis piasezkii]
MGCKWVFTTKYKFHTNLWHRLFGDFCTCGKAKSVRILLSLATTLDWPLQQLDIKNAFLNGDLKKKFICILRGQGYSQAQTNHAMFIKLLGDGKITILIVYVDDIILTEDDENEMNRLKTCLTAEFEIKDLGSLRYFLGIEVARSKKGIVVSQRKYILDLLKETRMSGYKPVDTPIDPNKNLGDSKQKAPLIYLSHTRLDIAFAVSMVSQFMHSPSKEHLEAAYRILRYLKSSPRKGLLFKKGGQQTIEGYRCKLGWAHDK